MNQKLGIGFWNKTLAVTLLYGSLTTLAAVELDRIMGVLPFLGLFDSTGLGVVIMAWGTLGMYIVRDRVLDPGQWIPARRFAVGLTGSLAIASAVAEYVPVVLVCLLVLLTHLVLPELIEG